MAKYTVETVTRIAEGASWEDIDSGDAYETVYLVYDSEGELIWETQKYDNIKSYIEGGDEE